MDSGRNRVDSRGDRLDSGRDRLDYWSGIATRRIRNREEVLCVRNLVRMCGVYDAPAQ